MHGINWNKGFLDETSGILSSQFGKRPTNTTVPSSVAKSTDASVLVNAIKTRSSIATRLSSAIVNIYIKKSVYVITICEITTKLVHPK